tara:strand:+ start:88 stop:1128 length:1041 start_codon:yes stop_codon:yes gene_type:complete
MEKQIISSLLNWYLNNQRDLPWRNLQKNKKLNPYYILVSEYMLQQTSVSTVKKRFEEFIDKWPTLKDLSKVSESRILKFWSGLGYYSRARNLLKTVKIINKEFNNKIPNSYNTLINFPGIGEYTAKAIMGIGYNKPVMPLDANIERIIARLYAYEKPIIKIKKQLNQKATKFISKKNSSDLIQSFMDYGSMICTPRNPSCISCNISKYCLAFQKKIQNEIPKKIIKQKKKPKKYTRAYVLLNENNEILVRTRSPKGMLASMLEVPNDLWVEKKSLLQNDEVVKILNSNFDSKGSIIYSFSHFNLHAEVYYKQIKKNKFPKTKWLNISKYSNSQLPTVMKKIVEVAL